MVKEGDQTVTIHLLKQKMAEFAEERDWDHFHSPRNLLLALVGEIGELSEIFQLSDICGIDLGRAALRKVELNALKYPVSLSKLASSKRQEAITTKTLVGNSDTAGAVVAESG
ncbi:hypothetical protein NL676_002281 [Syzygium grande]|nr:hypothetical protein NL676_002281 [Syzygium grande]